MIINSVNLQNINTNNQPHSRNIANKNINSNQPTTNFLGKRGRKINLQEGAEIFSRGMFKQAKETITSIIEHPLKTAAIVGGTTLGLMALPFIGIPTAVGGGVLALGYATYAIGKTTYHTIQFVNNNKNGNYNIARRNLQNIGEDTIDLALSTPFIPKSITRIQNFAKYGKLGLNQPLINNLKNKKSLWEQFKIIKDFDKNMSRNINYQSSVDKEIAKYKDLSATEKATLKKEILDYNAPIEDLPKVVLKKWAEKNGITAQPDIQYSSFPENIGGYAIIKDCSIILNDYKRKIPANSFSNYKQLSSRLVNNEYEITYKDLKSGNIFKETISKELLDKYNKLYEIERTLTPESRRILVTLHEREHIHHYAQIFEQEGFNWSPTTERGQFLYKNMINDIKNNPQCKLDPQTLNEMVKQSNVTTPLSYIKNPREIGARNAEWQALENPDFKILDNVFKTTNKMKTPNIKETIILNALRPESASS